MRPSSTRLRNLLAEMPIAAAASTSPSPNTTGKYGNMSTRVVVRLIVYN